MIDHGKVFKILIVDDVPNNIQVVAGILKSEGYQMTFSRSGESALEKTEAIDFDLILLDIMMPDIDGFQVCSRIKANDKTKDIPIIFLTAKNDAESIVKGLELGAVDYINKPFNQAELKARVKTHLQLKHTQEKLTHANATKDKFFSIIAHDLRNPFNHLLGFSELLLERFDFLSDEKKKEFITNIFTSSQSVYKLLENLLSWSRVQLGKFEWNPGSFSLNEAVDETVELLCHQAREKGITLKSDIIEDTVVYADADMTQTVVRNLVSNAIKFSQEGGSVQISSSRTEGFIQLSVEDNGLGMSPEDCEKLFKLDIHFTRSGTKMESGSGLGLILCREFVEKNGGQIQVSSAIGKGSLFTFTIPVKKK
jgi:two-component system, sensor histidine kinase and response regulator